LEITFQTVEHRYQYKTPFERRALYDVNVSFPSGGYYAIIGHTGSGKSTMIQHLNGLLQPTNGTVQIGEHLISSQKKEKKLKPLRKKVGVVFQFPEHQLFEETVLKDMMFGPMNFGVSEQEAEARAREMAKLVGLPDSVLEKSPFDLSGGQMRRVAIAGVLAMKPEVIVLDEPTAGLDPRGRKEIMDLFYRLYKEQGLTMILVTHSMEDAARYANRMAIMYDGRCVLTGTPLDIFSDAAKLAEYRLEVPHIIQFQKRVEQRLGFSLPKLCLTEEELAETLAQAVKGRER